MGETGFPARDPFVVADGGHYYLYASAAKPGAGGAAELRRGADLVMWTAPEPAVRFPSGAGGRTVSGPSVHRFGGTWWMFAAVSGGAGGPDGACSVCVFVSQRPEGPFKPATAGPVAAAACGGTLHVEDGKPHLVYSVSRDGRCAIEYAPLARGFASLAGRPSKLVDPPDGFAADGPSLHRSAKSGRLYLLWTRTGPGGERCIMARSSPSGKIAGPWTGDELLVAGACGRGMAFRGLDGRLRIVFERPGAEGNPMDIRYLDDDGARLSVEGR